MEWATETIASLRQLWDEGLSTKKIGDRLGTSKNAVVGKAHRLDLPSRPSPIRRRDPNAPFVPRKPRAPRVGRVSLPRLPSLSSGPALSSLPKLRMRSVPMRIKTTMSALRTKDAPTGRRLFNPPFYNCGCTWIIGQSGKYALYCDADITRGAFCDDHAEIAYVRTRDRRADSDAYQPTKIAA